MLNNVKTNNIKTETVLVTGGAGFIGSNLVRELLNKKYRVVCVDDFSGDLYDPALKEENIKEFAGNPNFIFYRVDIGSLENLRPIFEKERPVYVAHLAARANVRNAVKTPHTYVEVNVVGTLNILELSREHAVKNIVLASSGSVYGDSPDVPWKESQSSDKPVSPYGATKRAAEILSYTYNRNFGLNITCLRYFNAYGENNRPDLVPYIWAGALLRGEEIEMSGDGSRKRDYTYVGDVVRGTILALEKPLGFEIINIGNSSPLSLRELLSVFEKVIGSSAKVRIRPSNSVSSELNFADITKAKKLLDWEPKVSIEEGISKLISWFKDHRLKNIV